MTMGGVDHYLNDVFGNAVAYVDQRTGNEDIYLSLLKFEQPVPTEPCTFLSGIVGCYPLEGNTFDLSGNGHHGILHGGTFVGDKFGNVGGALELDGTDNYVSIPDAGGAFRNPGRPSTLPKCSACNASFGNQPGFSACHKTRRD